jgi:hypothetical protein
MTPIHPRPGSDPAARKAANEAFHAARRNASEAEELRAELDRLSLLTQALWELLRKKLQLKDEELVAMIRECDLLDGHLDGKPSRTLEYCPTCHNTLSLTTNTCPFCGVRYERKKPF